MGKVFFTADLHFGHKNILKICHKRRYACKAKNANEIEKHDEWLIDIWNKTVGKKDDVYIIGDFSFHSAEDTKKLLGRLNGNKYLILGNHDSSSEHLDGYFKQIAQIKDVTFKKTVYPFLGETIKVTMCHYPMLSWESKSYGAIMVHGHCHGNIDIQNDASYDLRVDVGFDGELANHGLVSLEQLYSAMLTNVKSKGERLMGDAGWRDNLYDYSKFLNGLISGEKKLLYQSIEKVKEASKLSWEYNILESNCYKEEWWEELVGLARDGNKEEFGSLCGDYEITMNNAYCIWMHNRGMLRNNRIEEPLEGCDDSTFNKFIGIHCIFEEDE